MSVKLVAEDRESHQRIHNAFIAAYKESEAAEEARLVLRRSLEARLRNKNAKRGKRIGRKKISQKPRDTGVPKGKTEVIWRSAFDVTEIEGTKGNEAALKAYIAGLQGQEARNRMVGEARKILKSGEGDVGKDSGENMDADKEDKKIATTIQRTIQRTKTMATSNFIARAVSM
ncbi:hypothetical protein BGX38DRAFT_1265551 [Terfezia claveryi]|nr:hypothetical protein BGX38DRAFT_1265551 [Terfezia claveryi]